MLLHPSLHFGNGSMNPALITWQPFCSGHSFNSLWPSDALWRHRSGSTLAHIGAVRQQAITWTNVDLSSVRPSDIHQRAFSQELPQPSISKISSKITYPKFHSNLPGSNELRVKLVWHDGYIFTEQMEAFLVHIKKLAECTHIDGRAVV